MKFLFLLAAVVLPNIPTITPARGTIENVLTNVLDWLLAIGGAVAVLVLVIGGIRYIVAAGNEAQIKEAKQTITYALIGLVVIILAWVIVRTINTYLISKPTGGGIQQQKKSQPQQQQPQKEEQEQQKQPQFEEYQPRV